jgi:hypothetical protein
MILLEEGEKEVEADKPKLKAVNSASVVVFAPYHREGLYFSGSEKYRVLYSIYCKIRQVGAIYRGQFTYEVQSCRQRP